MPAALALPVLCLLCHSLQNSAQVWYTDLHSDGLWVLVESSSFLALYLPEYLSWGE
jgi:hypothetical protein